MMDALGNYTSAERNASPLTASPLESSTVAESARTALTQAVSELDCGGQPDPEGVCAIKGCTDEMMNDCAEEAHHSSCHTFDDVDGNSPHSHGEGAIEDRSGSHACSSKAHTHTPPDPAKLALLARGVPEDGEEHATPSRWHIPVRPKPHEFPPPPPRLHRRWDRTARLIGDKAMRSLQSAHVVVFGMGGVGSFAVEGLARSGVGRLTLVDFDDVCVTNFNRQLHAVRSTIGKPKAPLMADRVMAINPDAWVEPIQAFYEASTSEQLLDPKPDFVVDCIDNVTAKMHLLATCVKRGIPVVSSMGAAAKLDPTRIKVADLSETRIDPLAKAIRKNMHKLYDIDCTRHTGITAVYSDELVNMPYELEYDATTGFLCVCPHRADSPHSCEKRSIIHGTAVFVTSVFGMTCASVVVRQLSEHANAPSLQV